MSPRNQESLKPFVILSASRAAWTQEANDHSTAALESQLAARDFQFVKVRGSYQGIEEDSFLVLCDPIADDYEFGMLLALAERYGQESILLVDNHRHAALYFLDYEQTEALPGTFQAIEPYEAASCASWTRRDNQYYTVK